MKDRYIGIAQNTYDISSAISLIKKVFYKDESSKEFLFPSESIRFKNIIIIKENSLTVAACLIHNRTMYFKKKSISSSFLSFICVDKSHRDRGLSKLLMDFAIQSCKDAGKKVCLVIARKKADYFYTKFLFFGFSNYPKIKIKSNLLFCEKKFEFNNLSLSSLNKIQAIYNKVYNELSGSFFRSYNDWEFIIEKGLSIDVNLKTIADQNGNLIGYVCYKKEDIYEIAFNNVKDYSIFLNNFMIEEKLNQITFHGGTNHPMFPEIASFDHSVSTRNCWYGGHMIRVIDKNFFLNIFSEEKVMRFQNNKEKFQKKVILDELLGNVKSGGTLFCEICNIPLMDQI